MRCDSHEGPRARGISQGAVFQGELAMTGRGLRN